MSGRRGRAWRWMVRALEKRAAGCWPMFFSGGGCLPGAVHGGTPGALRHTCCRSSWPLCGCMVSCCLWWGRACCIRGNMTHLVRAGGGLGGVGHDGLAGGASWVIGAWTALGWVADPGVCGRDGFHRRRRKRSQGLMEWIALAVAGVALMIGGVGVWLALRHPPAIRPPPYRRCRTSRPRPEHRLAVVRVRNLVAETTARACVRIRTGESLFEREAERLRTRIDQSGDETT